MFFFDKKKELLPGLPAAIPGDISGEVYAAGYALRPCFQADKVLTVTADKLRKDLDKLKPYGAIWDECSLQEGQLDFHLHAEGEDFIIHLQNETVLVRPGHSFFSPADEETGVRTVSALNMEDYLSYVNTLPYEKKWERETACTLAILFRMGKAWLYTYYHKKSCVAHFVYDPVSVDLSEFGTPKETNGLKPCFCQFSLKYGKMIHGVTADCGMIYLLSLPDHSILMIDGGEHEQATDEAIAELWRLLREMAEITPEDKLRLNWFCTHAHDDHTDGFAKLLRLYHDDLVLERVIFNFPSPYGQTPMSPQPYVLLSRIYRYFPETRCLKIHTGQAFELAGVSFEALQTHEDALTLARPDERIEFNDTSTVLKIIFDNVSMLITGDITETSARILMENYEREDLHTNGIQAAHHLINNLPAFYRYASPDLALVPQCREGKAIPENPPWESLCAAVPEDRIFFAGDENILLERQGEKLEVTQRWKRVGEAYDGSRI